jgi:hypothetical protein
VPRIIPAAEWAEIERGLGQRLTALNLFLTDIDHDQHILRDRAIDPALVFGGQFFRREFVGAPVPTNIYVHVCGTHLIRDRDGRYLVLEDNARTPSGVSHMPHNRQVLERVLPRLFDRSDVRPNDDYPACLHETCLRYAGPVTEWLAELRVEPVSDAHQSRQSFHLPVSQPVPVHRHTDGFGNRVHHFNMPAPPLEPLLTAAGRLADGDDEQQQ